MTEEEVRAVAKLSGGRLGTYRHPTTVDGEYKIRWYCTMYIPPKEYVGGGDDKAEAINCAWKLYENYLRTLE